MNQYERAGRLSHARELATRIQSDLAGTPSLHTVECAQELADEIREVLAPLAKVLHTELPKCPPSSMPPGTTWSSEES